MRPLKLNEIKGNWATLILHIKRDGSIDSSITKEFMTYAKKITSDFFKK